MSQESNAVTNKERVYKKLFEGKEYKNILDVGATAYTVDFLKKHFPSSFITGINIEIKDKNTSEIFFGNAEQLPFKDNSFDLIFTQETLEHVLFPDKFIAEAKRVLKSGGDIILDTPNLNTWSNRILILLGYPPTNYTPYPYKTPGVPRFLGTSAIWDHPRVFPFRSLKELFNSNGFKLKKITGVNQVEEGRSFRLFRIIVEKVLPPSWRDATILKATVEK